ncbi:PTS sugar transporter subunit IIA [Glaciihabitans sp. GrIS 2.15]|uniref:PTS sugar transporter subunit IIA n=1 Tax=Glaciihabitans sp. GrIS 2.15 TaxID=3071710 RepID=UPI002DF78B20|nr:PTS system mannitol-specific IIA component [Glaciihabitans sp. GrIS 2.15]
MTEETAPGLSALLAESSIRLDLTATDQDDAIRQTGAALLEVDAIDVAYIDAMLEREKSISTFVGEGVAIPHGTLAGKDSVKKDAIVVLRFPDGVDWDGNDVRVCVGIAARGNGHIALLSQLAIVLLDPDKAAVLRAATTSAEVYELLKPDPQDGYSP